jgi:hypothetical protein
MNPVNIVGSLKKLKIQFRFRDALKAIGKKSWQNPPGDDVRCDKATQAFADNKPFFDRLIWWLRMDAIIVRFHVRNKRVQVVEVQGLSVAQSPTPHVRSENRDSSRIERFC